MIPTQLKLHNFLSYTDDDIDFTKLDSIVLIRGINSETSSGDEDNNGAGKSALLDAIEWCLYGRVRGVFNKDLLKDDIIHLYEDGSRARKARIIYIFEMDEGFYRVMREKALNGPSALEVHFSKDRKKWDNYTLAAGVNKRTKKKETALKRTQQKIEDILNANCDLFINSAFFEQKNTNTFAMSSSGDKTNLLRLALYLDKWSDFAAVQKLKLADVDAEIRSVENDLQGKSVEHFEDELDRAEKDKCEYDVQLKGCQETVSKIEKERDTAIKELARAETKEEVQKVIKDNYQITSSRLTLLRQDRFKIKKRVESWEGRIEAYEEEIRISDSEIVSLVDRRSDTNRALDAIELDPNDYREANTKQLMVIATLTGEKKVIKSQKDNFQGDCPLMSPNCSRGSEDAHKTKIIKLDRDLFRIAKSVAIYEKAQRKLQKQMQKQRETDGLYKRFGELSNALGSKIERKGEVVEEQHKSLKIAEDESQSAQLDLKHQDENIFDEEVEVKELKEEYDRLENTDVMAHQVNLEKLNRSISGARSYVSEKERDIIIATQYIETIQKKLVKIRDTQDSFNELNDRKQVLQFSIKVLSKEIPHQLIEAALPEIETYAQDYIKDLSLGRMNIELNTQRETKKKDKDTKENILKDEINMDLESDGLIKKYALCSGGEQTRGDLSIHFSYATFMLNRSGAKIRSLFLDEVSMGLDTTGKKALLKLLKRLVDKIGFKKIFVISQDEKFNKLFDCVLTVKKTSEGSHICSG